MVLLGIAIEQLISKPQTQQILCLCDFKLKGVLKIFTTIISLGILIPIFSYMAYQELWSNLIVSLFMWFAILRFAHEGLHLLGYRLVGKQGAIVSWGVNASCRSNEALTSFECRLVVLAPLFVLGGGALSLLVTTGSPLWLSVFGVVLATSIEDIKMSFRAARGRMVEIDGREMRSVSLNKPSL